MRRFLPVLLFSLLVASSVRAGGRITVVPDDSSAPAGTKVEVNVVLLQSDSSDSDPSTEEKAEIIVRDPQNGQSCTTDPAPSNYEGVVTGTCTAKEPGTMTVYARSTDRGDESESATIEFTEKKPAASQESTSTTQQVPNQTAQQNRAGALANNSGLTEDRGNLPLIEGLETDDPDAQVAGAAVGVGDSAPATTNDLDLLTSLIFLTGGIIFVIAGVYFIYTHVSKNKSKTPPPSNPPAGSTHSGTTAQS